MPQMRSGRGAGPAGLVRSARAPQGLVAAGRADDRGGASALRDDRRPELLVRRGADREAGRDAVRRHAVAHPRHRAHAAALLRGGLAVGARVRHPRGGAAVAVRAAGSRGRAGRVPRRARADLAQGRTRGRRPRRIQPAARVVLAGGAAVLAARAALGAGAAVLRARRPAARGTRPVVVGRAVGARAADALLRRVPGRARGALARVDLAPALACGRGRGARGARGRRADPPRRARALEGRHRLHRGAVAAPARARGARGLPHRPGGEVRRHLGEAGRRVRAGGGRRGGVARVAAHRRARAARSGAGRRPGAGGGGCAGGAGPRGDGLPPHAQRARRLPAGPAGPRGGLRRRPRAEARGAGGGGRAVRRRSRDHGGDRRRRRVPPLRLPRRRRGARARARAARCGGAVRRGRDRDGRVPRRPRADAADGRRRGGGRVRHPTQQQARWPGGRAPARPADAAAAVQARRAPLRADLHARALPGAAPGSGRAGHAGRSRASGGRRADRHGPARGGAGGMNVRARRFPLLDSMRAIAFCCVLVAHAAFAAGFATDGSELTPYLARLDVGVRIFFLISAFLLYRPFVAARLRREEPPLVRAYAWRRFLRVAPPYWLALCVIALWLGAPGVFTVEHAPLYFGFAHIYDTHTLNVPGMPQAWSLCVEVSFYVFLPLYAALIRRIAGGLRTELIGAAVLFGGGLAYKLWTLPKGPLTDASLLRFHLALPEYIDYFAIGIALAAISVAGAGGRALDFVARRPWVAWLAALLGFL